MIDEAMGSEFSVRSLLCKAKAENNPRSSRADSAPWPRPRPYLYVEAILSLQLTPYTQRIPKRFHVINRTGRLQWPFSMLFISAIIELGFRT